MNKVFCPLGDCDGDSHIIGNDGGLRHMKHYLIPELIKIGWRRVDNPKRNYYPELDRTSASYRNETFSETDNNSDILRVIKL
ncbi:hypothetical protein M0R04_14300 [Candidatus Dojkabacteria bacterium]|jgi:hypothetical protein|nr:hypothetical protein [Candidatus Dojkabacteria bacterium]